MHTVFQLAERVLVDRLINKHSPVSHKSKAGLACLALAAFLFLAGLGFLIYAAYLWFNLVYPPLYATMVFGLTLVLTAFFLCLVLYGFTLYQRSQIIRLRRSVADEIRALATLLEEDVDIDKPVRDNPKTAVLMALAAGFICGDKYL